MYVDRLKAAESVLTGLDKATKFVSRLEIQLASTENMPASVEGVRKIQEDLMTMQSTVETHQAVIDQLTVEVGSVRQLTVRSRTSVTATVRKHPDVDRMEAEVKTVVTRWSNICTQIVER